MKKPDRVQPCLVYTFRVEEMFEFLSKSVHPRDVHGSYRLYEDKYIPRYVHGTSFGCRVPVGRRVRYYAGLKFSHSLLDCLVETFPF